MATLRRRAGSTDPSPQRITTISGPDTDPTPPELEAPAAGDAQPGDVHEVRVGERTFLVVGTAHVSQESADLVREVIEKERPDVVCVELDPQRYEALSRPERFEALDLRELIRRRQLGTLLANLVLAAYQKQLGLQLGVLPGAELLEAARAAEEHDIPVALCDRDVRITLRRAWGALSFWKKLTLVSGGFAALFDKPEVSEDDLRELRKQDVISQLMQELGQAFPALKRVLIDERDGYLAQKMRDASGERVVAVVGAGHVAGIRRALEDRAAVDLSALETLPPPSRWLRVLGWAIPVLILGALLAIGVRQGAEALGENALFWVLANGVPAAAGAAIALAHPLTIVAAFVSAPITSLTPVIGVGYVCAFLQTWLAPPLVRELREVSKDALQLRKWWSNRLLRILAVFVLTTIGSLIGTFGGGAEIFRNLFSG